MIKVRVQSTAHSDQKFKVLQSPAVPLIPEVAGYIAALFLRNFSIKN